MTDQTYVPRTPEQEYESHKLDTERTAWESAREHDPGTGSPQATGERSPEPDEERESYDEERESY
jgi:hypothetical protein